MNPLSPTLNPEIPERVKENSRNKRFHQVIPPKEVPANGHYLDRRSGTGRVDKPRKEGGGHGGIGNLNDELKKEKYLGSQSESEMSVTENEDVQEQSEQTENLNDGQKLENKGFKKENKNTEKVVLNEEDFPPL